MDSFIGLAKKGYKAYSESQSNVSKTGGQEYNTPHHSGPPTGSPSFDHDEVVRTAEKHGSADSSVFSSALSFVKQNAGEHNQPIDEDHVTNAHKKAYEEGSASSLSANSLGSAAALQALKKFTSGGSSSSSGGSGSQTQLISLAMAEATKLFEKSGGAASGNKQDAVNGAAMTVMKLFVQSKMGGSTTGAGNSGGLSGLLSLASQFSK
ncbi:beta-flanking protein [Armillaria gallica]|uniref:Beta-flanking protein n=1 Tax=Armillaria gallica TaxID=47427 RepID=A0A2H3DZD0_ARMGA|nr:beta-flanking protein [Armillaria gallica]